MSATKTIIVLGTTLLLSACGYSVEQLADDTELRRSLLKDCTEQGVAAKDDETCIMAIKAEALAAKNAAQDLMGNMGK